MKRSFKKFTAAVVAATTMAAGMVGMSANATEGTRSFSPNSTASLSVTNTSVSASTSCTQDCTRVTAQITSTAGGSITSGDTNVTYYGTKSSTATGYGTGFTRATSSHSVEILNGPSGSTTMEVRR